MRPVLELAAKNPVLLNVLFAVVVLGGIVSYSFLPKEQFPQIEVDRVGVTTVWPGAAPEDVEDLLLRPIEDEVASVDGLKHSFGEATEGVGLLTLEFQRGTDTEQALLDVERAITRIETLPDDSESPVAVNVRVQVPITHIALTGDITRVLLAEELADELRSIAGVQDVEILGAAEQVVRVDLRPEQARARGLDPLQVAGAIEAAGQAAPAGELDLQGQRVLVRTEKRLRTIEDVRQVPLDPLGQLRVGDVANVVLAWKDPDVLRHIDGIPSITMTLFRSEDADTLQVVQRVEDWVDERARTLPDGIGLRSYDDSAQLVRDRLEVVFSNAAVGILLVALGLLGFIGLRNALLVVWGMPVAYLGAVIAMQFTGVTINVISTFALLLVTGIIVDDAIVIVENVQRHLEMGRDRASAAIEGTLEVIPAVTASTLTTCLAFGPLMLLDGTVGRVMGIIPMVVIFSLAASLVEAFFILPGHLSHYAQERVGGENRLTRKLKQWYLPVLDLVTGRWVRYGALGGLFLGFFMVMSLTLVMRTSLTTPGNPYYVFLNVDLASSTTNTETRRTLARLEQFTREQVGEHVWWMSTVSGRQIDPTDLPVDGANYGQVKVGFHAKADSFAQVPAFLDDVRQWLGNQPEIVNFAIVELQGGPPVGRDIDFKVRSRSTDQVLPAADELTRWLESRDGVYDVRNEAGIGTEEFRIVVDAGRASRFGLREAQVAAAARAAFDGVIALELPIQERATEVEVRLAGIRAGDLESVRNLELLTQDGGSVRLRQVADVVRTRSVEQISRVDGERAVRVSALVDPDITTPEEVFVDLEAEFSELQAERHPDVDLFVGGALEDSAESFAKLPAVFGLAVLFIYGVLAVQFKSYLQPFIIVAAIPLGLAGVVLGLFVFGMDLSLIAMIGAVGLAGIVVNDSLVLIDFINRNRAAGMDSVPAVKDAALTRLRPILITTATTVLGLTPLAFGLAGSDPLLAPMAVAITFGLAFATVLTLVAIPVLYLVIEDIGGLLPRLIGRADPPSSPPSSPEPPASSA